MWFNSPKNLVGDKPSSLHIPLSKGPEQREKLDYIQRLRWTAVVLSNKLIGNLIYLGFIGHTKVKSLKVTATVIKSRQFWSILLDFMVDWKWQYLSNVLILFIEFREHSMASLTYLLLVKFPPESTARGSPVTRTPSVIGGHVSRWSTLSTRSFITSGGVIFEHGGRGAS